MREVNLPPELQELQIRYKIEKTMREIKSDPTVQMFVQGLEYKGKITRDKDQRFMELMFSWIERFAKGMLMERVCAVGKMHDHMTAIEEYEKQIAKDILDEWEERKRLRA